MEVPNTPPETIRAFDPEGKEILITREQWRTEVLPNLLRESWSEPEHLYLLILNSINDGFLAEILPAAQHLHQTDPIPARGTCTYAIALMESGQLTEAEQVLLDFLKKHEDEGSVLTNLAKIYSLRNQPEQAEQTLWRALQAEPNLDHGLAWFVQIHEADATGALERIAALPNAWRARLWLARGQILSGNLPRALELYEEAIVLAPNPIPGDFLMQMSGDLGGNGHLAELIALTTPHFVPELHGLPVGNNLIKANFDSGNIAAAAAIREQLARFNRPDWQAPLAFWEQEIARVHAAIQQPAAIQPPSQPAQIQVGMIRIDGPIWMPAGSPGQQLFADKPTGGPSVTFLGGTAETPPRQPGPIDPNILDGPGRMSRALPLFLAEQIDMRTAAAGRALLPWAVGDQAGFIVSGAAWSEQAAAQSVAPEAQRSDYVVTVHIDARVEPWTAELVFLRTADGARIGELDAEFPSTNPEQALPGLADQVVELLGGASGPRGYQAPLGTGFTPYLARLEQLLAVRCAAMPGVPDHFLQGERDILTGQLTAAAVDPDNLASRLLLIETMAAVERLRPATAAEFRPHLDAFLGSTTA